MRFLSSVSWSRSLDIVQVRFVVVLRSLSKHVFELRTSTGSVVFFPPLCLYATWFVLLSVFTHKKKICLRIIGKNTTRWLPVDVRRSKTSLLKLPIMGRDEVEVNKNGKKTRPIFSHFDWTNLVNKGFIIITKKRTFSCGTNAWNPEWVHLARSLSQSKHRIRFILPAGGVSHI